jgi:hypothetical protein
MEERPVRRRSATVSPVRVQSGCDGYREQVGLMSLWATANPTVRQDRGHAEASALALVVEAAQPGPFLFDCIS